MTTRVRTFSAAVLLAIATAPGRLAAQERDLGSSTPLRVKVRTRAIDQLGDTITISYRVDNTSLANGEDLWILLVDAPAPGVRVLAPNKAWVTGKTNVDRATARWTLNSDTLIRPGQSTPALGLTAIGVTGLVEYWAVPDLPAHPPLGEDDSKSSHRDPMKAYGDSGMTIGIVPLPASSSVSDLFARLRRFLSYSCAARWITRNECKQLSGQIGQAAVQFDRGNPKHAADKIDEFVKQLSDDRGAARNSSVSPEAFALLNPNAAYLQRRLRGIVTGD